MPPSARTVGRGDHGRGRSVSILRPVAILGCAVGTIPTPTSEVIAASSAIDHAAAAGEASSPATAAASFSPAVHWAVLAGYAALAILVVALARRARWLALPASPRPRTEILPSLAALFFGFLAAQVGGLTLLRLLAPAASPDADPLRERALMLYAGLVAQLPFAVLTLWLLRPGRDDAARWPATFAGRVLLGFGGLLAGAPLILAASSLAGELQARLWGTPPPAVAHETLRQLATGPSSPWAMAIMAGVVVLGPFIEEATYRGALQGAFRAAGFSPWTSIVMSTAAFVLMHIPAIPREGMAGALAGLTALALVLGLLRERSRSIVPSVIAHAAFNVANLAIAGAFGGLFGGS